MWLFELYHFETGNIHWWTMGEILSEINRDRSVDWCIYDETDFIEGLEVFTEYRLTGRVKKPIYD